MFPASLSLLSYSSLPSSLVFSQDPLLASQVQSAHLSADRTTTVGQVRAREAMKTAQEKWWPQTQVSVPLGSRTPQPRFLPSLGLSQSTSF